MNGDVLAAIILLALGALTAAYVMCVPPGGLIRLLGGEHTGGHVRPAGTPRPVTAKPKLHHARPARAHPVPAERSVPVTTIPDPAPFVRAA